MAQESDRKHESNKPEKFGGLNFKRWKNKMFFYLSLKEVAFVLSQDCPVMPNPEPEDIDENGLILGQISDWKDADFKCRNFILNGLSDELYDYYLQSETAKSVWEALQKKYDTEEAGSKKFAVSRYLKYTMVDDKLVNIQSHELQHIAHEIISEGIPLDEQFQVAVMIDKLPPGWKDFKNVLRHKSKELTMENLITRLRVEEESRKQDQKEEVLFVQQNKAKVHLKPKNKQFKKNANRKFNSNNCHNGQNGVHNPNKGNNQQAKTNNNGTNPIECWKCHRFGHIARNCRSRTPAPQANAIEGPLVAMITEINMVGATDGWWADTGATRHVCFERSWFKTYEETEGQQVQLGDSHCINVKSLDHHDETPEQEETHHSLNEKVGRNRRGNRGRGLGQSHYRGSKQHYSNGHGHGHGSAPTSSRSEVVHNKPPPGPRMPDGTRGFAMGRGRPPTDHNHE